MWYELEGCKQYIKDWDKDSLYPIMIMDAIQWLCPMSKSFNKVDSYTLYRLYNEQRKLKWDATPVLEGARRLIEAKSGRKVNHIEFEDGSLFRYNVLFDGIDTPLYFNLREDMVLVV
jgi:hypothetical protein